MDHTTGKRSENRELLHVLWKVMSEMVRSAPLVMCAMFVLAAICGILPAVTILVNKWIIDDIARASAGSPISLLHLAIVWTGVAALGMLCQIFLTLLQGYAADFYTIHTMRKLMNKMAMLPGLDVIEDPKFNDDIEILQSQAGSRPLNLIFSLQGLVRAVIGAISVSATLLVVGWWVPLVVVIGMLPAMLRQLELYKLGWSIFMERTQDARELKYLQRIALNHEYAKEIRLYNLLPFLKDQYLSQAGSYQKSMRSIRNKRVVGVLPYQGLSFLVTATLFIYTVSNASVGLLSAGTIILVVSALAGLRDQIAATSENFSMANEHLRWFTKYYDFLKAVPKVAQIDQAQSLPQRFDITFNNVTFGYRDLPSIIEGVSFTVPEGQIVAVVGENGAGKSTLVKLLLRFYDPISGSILLGEKNKQVYLKDADLTAWRNEIAVVFQDFARFEWTLRENVLLGSVENFERLSSAVSQSGLESSLNRVSGGLNARIGLAFGGIDLSGGQWQKLATARALYRNARILILDEPTSALDPRSEKEIFDTFASMARGRTTILITHRLGSVTMADRILVMKAGRLIEDGTHDELLDKGGEYAELWHLQSQQYGGFTS